MIEHFVKNLFLGSIEGQFKICRTNLTIQVLPKLDKIVCLGNLIACTKESRDTKNGGRNELVLTFWDKINKNPLQEKFIQKVRLIGRNEMVALNQPNSWTNNASNNFLRDGWLSPAAPWVVAAVDKGRLITHGGLTFGEWKSIGSPDNAQDAADLLNEKYANTLEQGRCFALDGKPFFDASPIWADPVLELYPSWVTASEACPFDQIHGFESLNTDRGRSAVAHPSHPLFYVDSISYRKFGSITSINDTQFRGIDLQLPRKTIPSVPADKAFYVENV